jgi:hypothetical protein
LEDECSHHSRQDLIAASFNNSSPRLIDIDDRILDAISSSKPHKLEPGTEIFPLDQLELLFLEIRELRKFQTRISRAAGATIPEVYEFDTRRNHIEHKLIHIQTLISGDSQDERLLKACCVGALIYTAVVFRNFQSTFAVLNLLKRKLMHTLGDGLINYSESKLKFHFHLWVLFVGGTLCSDLEEKAWFVRRIIPLVRQEGLNSWNEIESYLRVILWTSKLYTTACVSVWQDVGNLIGVDDKIND